ncbi:cullin-1 [Cryptomeria japonica]|uniref:cullin-1 n=1 Tax=Cryptomeria japonica TaxID=3369 RepID=UPI0027DA59D1|nr:cullin-1 [Cryptomeria japonica]
MTTTSIDLSELKNLLEALKDGPISGNQHMDAYATVYNLCNLKCTEHNYSDELYNLYKTSINDYILSMVLPAVRQKHGEVMLRELDNRWKKYKAVVERLSHFFAYLDRFYVTNNSVPTLGDVGLQSFLDLVYCEIKINARDAMIALIEREREGEQIDRSLLKNVVDIFVEVGMGEMDCYLNDFEAPMLEDSGAYYSQKAASWIIEDSCPEYLLKVEETLQLEKHRAFHFLHSSREKHLLDKVQNELLARYEKQILEKDSGLWALLRDNKKDDLSRMFNLFNKVDKGLDPIANTFKQFVIVKGTELIKQAEDAKKEEKRDSSGAPKQEFVRRVIEMHDKYEHYVLECFQNHKLFQKALQEAFETFCNKGPAKYLTAESLSAFSDNLLKKGSTEKLSDDEIDLALENVVKILEHVENKDVFAEFYRKKFARRLLVDKCPNDCNERSMLAKLKEQNGAQFTSKMEGMITDFFLSKENQNKFVAHLNREDIHVGLDLNVTVLTTWCWPTYKSPNINLPIDLEKCIGIFKQFYSKETANRILTWMYSLGTCTVEGRFNDRIIELVLSTSQAALLMLFNEFEKLSFGEIKSQLNLEDDDANRVLHSLACANYKVLIKYPNTQKIEPTDYFEFNSRFADNLKSRRIKIPFPQNSDEKKKVIDDVEQTRKHLIDCKIVKIMKKHKLLSYQELQSKCVEELKKEFKPDFRAIKRRIEDLISKDYLERDKDDQNKFKYLA